MIFRPERLQTLPVALERSSPGTGLLPIIDRRQGVSKEKNAFRRRGDMSGPGFPLLSRTLSWSAARQERQDGQKQRQRGRFGCADWIGKLVRQGIGAGGGYFIGAAEFHHHQIILTGYQIADKQLLDIIDGTIAYGDRIIGRVDEVQIEIIDLGLTRLAIPDQRSGKVIDVVPFRGQVEHIVIHAVGAGAAGDRSQVPAGRAGLKRRGAVKRRRCAQSRAGGGAVGVHSGGKLEIKFGLEHLLTTANPWPLVAALLLLGLPFLITTWRWRKLMAVQGLKLPYGKCLTLTFVGQFYSTFLPGTTSGDVVKIIYTGRITGQKTKSAVTVLLDRVIGLVGLMIVGGLAAGGQLLVDMTQHRAGVGRAEDPLLLHVLGLIVLLLLALGAGATVYFSSRLRRWLGMDALLARLPLPEFIKHADRTLRAYRGHKGVLAATLLASMVSQALLPLAGWLAGQSFGMRAPFGFYMAYVPVAVLASSLPIVPPQGLGVLDALILRFFVIRGVDTASQAFALAQAIRFMPIFWNMLGAYWVVHDHYSRPHLESLQELAPENGAAAPAGM